MDQRQSLINLCITMAIIATVGLGALIFRNRHPNQVQVKHGAPSADSPTTTLLSPAIGTHPVEKTFLTFPSSKIKLVDVPTNQADSLRLHLPEGDAVFAHYFVHALDNSDEHLDRVGAMAKYFGNVSKDTVIETGREALAYTKELLSTHTYMLLTRWEKAVDGRYYGLIWVEYEPNTWAYLSELLVRKGFARVDGVTTPLPNTNLNEDDYVQKLLAIGKTARQNRAGIWAKTKK